MGKIIDRKTLKSSTNTQYGRDAKSAKADTHHAGFGRANIGVDFMPKKPRKKEAVEGTLTVIGELEKKKEKEKP